MQNFKIEFRKDEIKSAVKRHYILQEPYKDKHIDFFGFEVNDESKAELK